MKIKENQVIKLKKEQARDFEPIFSELAAHLRTIEDLSKIRHQKKQELWDEIYKHFPELRGYRCEYNGDDKEIKVMRKKGDYE